MTSVALTRASRIASQPQLLWVKSRFLQFTCWFSSRFTGNESRCPELET